MAARKNAKPLTILVHPDLVHTQEVQELIRKGHPVNVMSTEEAGYDIVFGKNCWRMTEELIALVEVSVKACRAVKYKRKVKEETEDDD